MNLSQVKGKDLRNKSNPPCAISFKEIRHVSFHFFHCIAFPRNNKSLQGPPIIPLPTRRRNRGPKGSRAVTAIGPPKNGLDISGHFAYTLYLDTKVFASFAKVYLTFLHDQDYIMYCFIYHTCIVFMLFFEVLIATTSSFPSSQELHV